MHKRLCAHIFKEYACTRLPCTQPHRYASRNARTQILMYARAETSTQIDAKKDLTIERISKNNGESQSDGKGQDDHEHYTQL